MARRRWGNYPTFESPCRRASPLRSVITNGCACSILDFGGPDIATSLTEGSMDADIINVGDRQFSGGQGHRTRGVLARSCASAGKVMGRILRAVEKPDLLIKSQKLAGVELRAQFEGRIGLAGVVDQGQLKIGFPFVKDGRPLEVRVSEVVSGSGGREGWIIGETGGMTIRFYDLLHSTGRSRWQGSMTGKPCP